MIVERDRVIQYFEDIYLRLQTKEIMICIQRPHDDLFNLHWVYVGSTENRSEYFDTSIIFVYFVLGYTFFVTFYFLLNLVMT